MKSPHKSSSPAHAALGLRALLLAVARSLFGRRKAPARLSLPRLIATFLLLPFCLLLYLVHCLGFALDNVLFRGYKNISPQAPLFVVGPPRCGTTLLHRLLARDTGRFTSFSLGELIFAPSISERYCWAMLGQIDALAGRPLEKSAKGLEAWIFRNFNRLHRVSFFEPEEDFLLLVYRFANPILTAMFPYPDLMGPVWRLDEEMPRPQRDALFAFYKRCVQRHLYFHGAERVFLSKNPFFSPMVETVGGAFPNARFAFIARDPALALPSILGLWNTLYGFFKNAPDHYMARDFALDFTRHFYIHAAGRLRTMPAEQAQFIPFGGLTADPLGTLESMYARFGWAMDAKAREAIGDAARQSHEHKSKQRFGLEHFGLDANSLDAYFDEIRGAVPFGMEGAMQSADPDGPARDSGLDGPS